jgi:hypothetical protein
MICPHYCALQNTPDDMHINTEEPLRQPTSNQGAIQWSARALQKERTCKQHLFIESAHARNNQKKKHKHTDSHWLCAEAYACQLAIGGKTPQGVKAKFKTACSDVHTNVRVLRTNMRVPLASLRAAEIPVAARLLQT